MQASDRAEVIKAMRLYGGSFVNALAMAWERADEINAAKIEAAFPEYIERYKAMAGPEAA